MTEAGLSLGWRKRVAALVIAAGVLFGITSHHRAHAQTSTAAPVTKILFLAGPKEHGSPGRHEYEKDLRELAWAVEHAGTPNRIVTQVIVGKPPQDLSLFEDVNAIVIDGNGDWLKRETGMLFQQFADTDGHTYNAETTQFLKGLDALIKRKKIGVSVFHYTMWVENWVGRKYFLDWLGGLWIPYASQNPVDTWSIAPIGHSHPILRGVKPWASREEMYSHYFLPQRPGRTELLTAKPAKIENGTTGTVAWAYDRKDGGRSFVWGGNDFHDNMHLFPQQRRFLVNGVLWTAGVEVPKKGADTPEPPQL